MSFLGHIPLVYAKVLTGFLYLLLVFWVMRRPRGFIMQGAPSRKRWRDLRLWALLLIAFQIALYMVF